MMNPNDEQNQMQQPQQSSQANQQPATSVQPTNAQPAQPQQAAQPTQSMGQMPNQQPNYQQPRPQQSFQNPQQGNFQGAQANFQRPPFPGQQGQPNFQGYQQSAYQQPNFQASEQIPADTPMAQSVSFSQAISLGFHYYTRFRGGASLSEFWFWQLFYVIVAFAAGILDALLANIAPALGNFFIVIVELIMLLPTIAVSVRRLHDAGYTGYLYFLSLIPFGGSIAVLVLCAMKSKRPLPAGWWKK